MNILRELAEEIASMFAGDAMLSLAVLASAALAAAVRFLTPAPPLAAGAILFVGCAIALTLRVLAAAKK